MMRRHVADPMNGAFMTFCARRNDRERARGGNRMRAPLVLSLLFSYDDPGASALARA